MTIEEFIAKYGTTTPSLLVAEFIRRAPPFEGETALAMELGAMMADLETALKQVKLPK